jgi:hypothetical protein
MTSSPFSTGSLVRRSAATLAGLLAAAAAVTGAAGAAQAAPEWRTTETSWTNPQAVRPLVVGLRWAEHPDFDRVVVDVEGRRPGFSTIFTDKLSYDPSGKPVPLKGRYKTYLVLRPAATYTNSGTSVYEGARLARPGLPALRGLALTGSWEGDTSFGFTSRTRPYRVFSLTSPSRIVIDFRHPAG